VSRVPARPVVAVAIVVLGGALGVGLLLGREPARPRVPLQPITPAPAPTILEGGTLASKAERAAGHLAEQLANGNSELLGPLIALAREATMCEVDTRLFTVAAGQQPRSRTEAERAVARSLEVPGVRAAAWALARVPQIIMGFVEAELPGGRIVAATHGGAIVVLRACSP
jgi:hypothetical protein